REWAHGISVAHNPLDLPGAKLATEAGATVRALRILEGAHPARASGIAALAPAGGPRVRTLDPAHPMAGIAIRHLGIESPGPLRGGQYYRERLRRAPCRDDAAAAPAAGIPHHPLQLGLRISGGPSLVAIPPCL